MSKRNTSRREWIEVGASLVGGAGIGAALMYLFDPQQGRVRRAHARDAAGCALSSAGEKLGQTWQTISEKARDAGKDVADTAGQWAGSASSTAQDYAKRARGWMGGEAEHSRGSAMGLSAGACCALALGAGLMFLFDPTQGRRRRALLRDKTYSAARHSSDYVQRKGRHWSNKARGLAAEARGLASDASEKFTGSDESRPEVNWAST